MLRAVLFVIWRWTRWVIVALAIFAFAVPIITAATLGGLDLRAVPVRDVLTTFAAGGLVLIPFAIVAGTSVAAAAWSMDQQLGMVYMLVHPVPRWYLVLLRFASGAVVLLVPACGLLVGALIVGGIGHGPELLRAYPVGLSIRFLSVMLVSYGAVFGLVGSMDTRGDQAQDARAALRAVLTIVTVVVTLVVLDRYVFKQAIADALLRFLVSRWSPLGVFIGRWGLYDV